MCELDLQALSHVKNDYFMLECALLSSAPHDVVVIVQIPIMPRGAAQRPFEGLGERLRTAKADRERNLLDDLLRFPQEAGCVVDPHC